MVKYLGYKNNGGLCHLLKGVLAMLEQVDNKIKELKEKQREEYYRKKDEDLLEWGLASRKDGKRTIPIIVTDEEYEALIEASSGLKSAGRNKVASLLNIVSIMVIALGCAIGGVLGAFSDGLGAVYFSAGLVISILLSFLFRGVAEAITLLQQILDMKRAEDFKALHKEQKKAFPDTQPHTQQYTQAPPVHFAYPAGQTTVFTAQNVVYDSGMPNT